MNPTRKKLWVAILILAILTPVGIALPVYFKAGDAWGEWSLETIDHDNGFVPEGMKKIAGLWSSPIPDYSFTAEEDPFTHQAASYIGSAVIGLILVTLVMTVITKFSGRKNRT